MHRTAYILLSVLVLLGAGVPAAAVVDCKTAPDGTECDDGIFCNGADACGEKSVGGQLVRGCFLHVGDPCLGAPVCANVCNEAADTCIRPKGTPCEDDANACTDDECDGKGACTHAGNADPCNDGLFCNGADTCDGGKCSVHEGDPCAGGPECANLCTEQSGGHCLVPAGEPCADDENECTNDECDGAGACVHLNNNGSCDDGQFCTATDICVQGTCVGIGDPCANGPACADSCNENADDCFSLQGTPCPDDGNACTDNECDGLGDCRAAPNNDPCDDGKFCNGTDTCDGGECSVHAGDPCPGGPECNDGTCNENDDNCFTPLGTPCKDDGNPCTDDQCNGLGKCAPLPNDDPCNDGRFCNGDDQCSGGSCRLHTGDPCAGAPECALACDEQSDACAIPLGTPCSPDGNPCTDDLCLGGECTHVAVPGCQICTDDDDCDDANPCTLDRCAEDGCENTRIADCLPCAVDEDCDDGDACTVDSCGPENRCSYTDTTCFTAVTCPFFDGLALESCAGERTPRAISRLIDRAGCMVEQAEKRARARSPRVEKKLKIAERSLTKAMNKVNKAGRKKLSEPCAEALFAEIADRASRIAALTDEANGNSQLAVCTDALATGDGASAQASGPSLCGKR